MKILVKNDRWTERTRANRVNPSPLIFPTPVGSYSAWVCCEQTGAAVERRGEEDLQRLWEEGQGSQWRAGQIQEGISYIDTWSYQPIIRTAGSGHFNETFHLCFHIITDTGKWNEKNAGVHIGVNTRVWWSLGQTVREEIEIRDSYIPGEITFTQGIGRARH